MQRRDFLAASAAATTTAVLPLAARAQSAPPDARKFCEWRTYRTPTAEKRAQFGDYLEKVALPAWQQLDIRPVGVFTETGDGAGYAIHVFLAYPSLAKFAEVRDALERNPQFQKDALNYVAQKSDPDYERIDSWLMVTFAGSPDPTPPKTRGTLCELRTYESHSEERARKKIEMFNSGEIPIFPQCGFENVFFGEVLTGAGLPCLKYMLSTPHDMKASEEAWNKFRAHPDWVAMKDKPEYKDAVSKVSRLFLEPTPYSQI